MIVQELLEILTTTDPNAEVVLFPFKEGSILNNYLDHIITLRKKVLVQLVFGRRDV